VSAIACYGGGIFVASGHEIIYLQNAENATTADIRRTDFTEFGGTNTLSAGELVNSFNWCLDCRIHAATAGIGGGVSGVASNSATAVSLEHADFSFDPRTLTLSSEAGPAQSGLSFDDRCRKFCCDFTRPLRLPIYE